MVFDSCATSFMTPFKDHFSSLELTDDGEFYTTANGQTQVKGTGTVQIKSFNGREWLDLVLRDVLYIPTLPSALFSEPAADLTTIINRQTGFLELKNNNTVLFTGVCNSKSSEPFKMNLKVVRPNSKSMIILPIKIIHQNLGHCPVDIINKTIDNDLVSGVKISSKENFDSSKCSDCLEFKMRKSSNKRQLIKTKVPGEIIHVDTYSSKIKTYKNLNCAFVFADEATRLINIQFVKNKSQTLTAFNRFLAFQRKILGVYPVEFHSDNGREFIKTDLIDLLDKLQISQSFSTPYVKQENGLVESTIRHLINTTNTIQKDFPKNFWNELFLTSAYLINLRYKKFITLFPLL